MNAWVTNTKIGKETIMYNERGILNPTFNTDINNIRENDWVLYDSNASVIVFESSHIVLDIDFRPILNEHIARKEKITVVYKSIPDASQEFLSSATCTVDERRLCHLDPAATMAPSRTPTCRWRSGSSTGPSSPISLSATRPSIRALWHARDAGYLIQNGIYKVHSYEFKGYARCFDSFEHYCDYCFELLDPKVAAMLFAPEWPHYTATHDTPPALYGEKSSVSNSFVSNGAVIEGEVSDSVISRHVKIGKGSVIKHCILFSNVSIGENCVIENALIDKYSIITKDHKVVSPEGEMHYLKQGVIL
jgi:glucose-1-phosphate adenylyltransferase